MDEMTTEEAIQIVFRLAEYKHTAIDICCTGRDCSYCEALRKMVQVFPIALEGYKENWK